MLGRLALSLKLFLTIVLVGVLPGCAQFDSVTLGKRAAEPSNISLVQSGQVLFSHALPIDTPYRQTSDWSPTSWRQPAIPSVVTDPKLPVTKSDDGVTLRSFTVYFNNDQDSLTPNELDRLHTFLKVLGSENQFHFELIGHTDINHSAAYNLGLSKRRAESVHQQLLQWGIPADRIKLAWQGRRQPMSLDNTTEARAKNRRVDIRLKLN